MWYLFWFFLNHLSRLSVFNLPFFQSWFLSHSETFFSLVMIFFITSTMFPSSGIRIVVVVLVVLLGSVILWFSIFFVSAPFVSSYFIFSSRLLHIFLVFQDQKKKTSFLQHPHHLVRNSFVCCIKLNKFLTFFYNSFSITSLCRVAFKIAVDGMYIVFSTYPFFILFRYQQTVNLIYFTSTSFSVYLKL